MLSVTLFNTLQGLKKRQVQTEGCVCVLSLIHIQMCIRDSYMAMQILWLRVEDGAYNTFRCVRNTEGITRRLTEDRKFLQQCTERNLGFLKSIPNSVQYWQDRKRHLFTMLRQLGKLTVFLTVSANDIYMAGPICCRLCTMSLKDYFKDIQLILTTLKNTTMALTFSRYINVTCSHKILQMSQQCEKQMK